MIIGIAIFLIGLGLALSDPEPRGFWGWVFEVLMLTLLALVCGWISVILFPPLT